MVSSFHLTVLSIRLQNRHGFTLKLFWRCKHNYKFPENGSLFVVPSFLVLNLLFRSTSYNESVVKFFFLMTIFSSSSRRVTGSEKGIPLFDIVKSEVSFTSLVKEGVHVGPGITD